MFLFRFYISILKCFEQCIEVVEIVVVVVVEVVLLYRKINEHVN